MSDIKIFEAERDITRMEFVAELRRIADELESRGVVTYGEADEDRHAIAVPEEVRREFEIKQRQDLAGFKLDIEINWAK